MLEVSHDHWLGDQSALETLVRLSDEELKHHGVVPPTAAAVVAGSFVKLFDPVFQGLAISLMTGEVAATFLSRLAAPVVYYLIARRGRTEELRLEGPPPALAACGSNAARYTDEGCTGTALRGQLRSRHGGCDITAVARSREVHSLIQTRL